MYDEHTHWTFLNSQGQSCAFIWPALYFPLPLKSIPATVQTKKNNSTEKIYSGRRNTVQCESFGNDFEFVRVYCNFCYAFYFFMLHACCFSSKSGNADIRHVTIRREEPVKTQTELRKSIRKSIGIRTVEWIQMLIPNTLLNSLRWSWHLNERFSYWAHWSPIAGPPTRHVAG